MLILFFTVLQCRLSPFWHTSQSILGRRWLNLLLTHRLKQYRSPARPPQSPVALACVCLIRRVRFWVVVFCQWRPFISVKYFSRSVGSSVSFLPRLYRFLQFHVWLPSGSESPRRPNQVRNKQTNKHSNEKLINKYINCGRTSGWVYGPCIVTPGACQLCCCTGHLCVSQWQVFRALINSISSCLTWYFCKLSNISSRRWPIKTS